MSLERATTEQYFFPMGISDLPAYTAGANAHIRFISDYFPHMNEARNRSENIGIHVGFFFLITRLWVICCLCHIGGIERLFEVTSSLVT